MLNMLYVSLSLKIDHPVCQNDVQQESWMQTPRVRVGWWLRLCTGSSTLNWENPLIHWSWFCAQGRRHIEANKCCKVAPCLLQYNPCWEAVFV